MFNLASKILFQFVDPPALILLLLVIALIIRKRWTRLFLATYAVAILLLYLLACPTTSQWMLTTLEGQYPDRGVTSAPSAQAIVVLGGSLNMPSDAHPLSGITKSSDRILEALRLYRAGKAPLIVLSGGDSPLLVKARKVHEAEEMRSLLEEWGVPDSAIAVEDRSINTHENAVFTHELLKPRGIGHIILVTSAMHMPRAAATFRKTGFDVVPVPADFFTGWEESVSIFNWFPESGALGDSSAAIREWIGIVVYRLRGWA
jgi:uncharacterized SAM-binding protein YcdF (DUF218 family)